MKNFIKLKSTPTMPVLFVGHGNPMLALSDNEITKEWSRVGALLTGVQAVVVISAHWLTNGTHVTSAEEQRIIYDFYGFPDELYKVEYKAKGSLMLAEKLVNELKANGAELDDTWGLDHGAWVVLRHILPNPHVPVLQISLDIGQSLNQLHNMFAQLKTMRKQGVLFIGSGNIVHNLRAIDFGSSQRYNWAKDFDDAIANVILGRDNELLLSPDTLESYRLAAPTDDHYRPLIAAMSLIDEDDKISFFNDVIDMGSISMRSFIASW